MSITIGSLSLSTLNAQPYGYDESNTTRGFTARSWAVSGIVTPAQWLSLIGIYDTWRNLKINESPAVETGVVGATVALSGKGPGGQVWTNIPCWFKNAPDGDQRGSYIAVSFLLIDANQALQVLIKTQEQDAGEEELDLGTFTINGVVLKLKKPPDAYEFTPTLEQTANGSHYVAGSLSATLIKDIEGETNLSGWNSIRSWYQAIVQSTPAKNTYFPVTPPTAAAENKIVSGAKTVVYIVSVRLALVK
jgi:hypothetical protein